MVLARSERSQRVYKLRILAEKHIAVVVKAAGGHETLFAPAAVTFSRRRELQPDLLVLPLLDGRKVERFGDVGRLLLAVEVLSPSTSRNDRYKKRAVYQQEGVPEFWRIDPAARLVERWRPRDVEPEVFLTAMKSQPLHSHPPLAIDLDALFREARTSRARVAVGLKARSARLVPSGHQAGPGGNPQCPEYAKKAG